MIRSVPKIIYILLLAAWPRLLWGQNSNDPLCYEAYQDGTVIVTDGPREIVRIIPHLYAGEKIFVQQAPSPGMDNSIAFKALPPGKKAGSFNAGARVDGVEIYLWCRVKKLEKGLHIHYLMIPRENLEVGDQ